jgi:2-hydroxy-3-oxopropionate reductase
MLNIGYIGLGLMGKPITKNILKAGFPLVVNNHSHGAVGELVNLGADSATSPAEMAARVVVIFTNLPDSPDVEIVTLGKDEIIESAHPGLICVDNSTIKPVMARKIAEELHKKGIEFLDAAVCGGDIRAQNGTLTIMVGGSEEALEKVRPVLNVTGKTINHVGSSGAGQIAKADKQILVAAQMVAMGELIILSKKSGANPEKMVAAIRTGTAQCWALDNKPQRLFAGDRKPGFKA